MPPTHAIGIDLGTTYSCIAYLNEHGEPITIPNKDGELSTPSVVWFDDDHIIVGTEALRNSIRHPDKVVVHAKRYMGNPAHRWTINGKSYSPIDISAFILKSMLDGARARVGEIQRAVITVPAQFSDVQRQATAEAGQRAGLKHVDIINEPVASALCFVLGTEGIWFTEMAGAQTILVVDLGESTFDLALVRYQKNEVRVIASSGDLHLGGLDWNKALEVAIAKQFQQEFGIDPLKDRDSAQALAIEAEQAKRSLSVRPKAGLTCAAGGYRKTFEVSLEQFERLTKDLVDRMEGLTLDLLQEHNIGWMKIDAVLTTGGSSRMPMMRSLFKRLSGRTLNTSLSPDQSIAHGATYYAGMLLSNSAFAQSILNPTAAARLTQMRGMSGLSDFASNSGMPSSGEGLLDRPVKWDEPEQEDNTGSVVFAAYPTESREDPVQSALTEEPAVVFSSLSQEGSDDRLMNRNQSASPESFEPKPPATPPPPSENFYHKFLDLPPDVTRPDHYQLLGVERFTDDLAAMKKALIERSTLLRGWDNSNFFREANKVLDEAIAANFVLEDPQKKAEYDRSLGRTLSLMIKPVKTTSAARVEPPAPAATPVASAPTLKSLPRPAAKPHSKKSAVVETSFPPQRDGVVQRSRRDRGLWGLDVGTTGLRAVRLKPPQGVFRAMILSDADLIPHELPLDCPDANPKELLAQTLTAFANRHDLSFDRVAINCPHENTVTKWFILPPVYREHALGLIKHEAQQQIPFPLEDVVWDHQLLIGPEESSILLQSRVLLVAAKKEELLARVLRFLAVGVPAELIQLPTLAAVNCLLFEDDTLRDADVESTEYKGVISVGASSSWIQMTNGFDQWSRSIPMGGTHFTRAFSSDLNLTWDDAENLKYNSERMSDPRVRRVLRSVFYDFVSELQRSIGYFLSVSRQARIRELLTVGEGWRVAGLQDFCRESLTQPLRSLGPLLTLVGDDAETTAEKDVRNAPWFRDRESSFVVAYGLALQLAQPTACAVRTSLFPPELRPNWFRRTLRHFAGW